jgi:enamine deaminase RidA (YjgF/YER057c/UK114 family)
MSAQHIERLRGDAAGRSAGSAWRDLVFTVATAHGATLAEQTHNALAAIEKNLHALGSDRSRMLSATVYLSDIAGKAEMDTVWCEWIGEPANWPQRACVQAALAPGALVEITVIGTRG